MGKAEKINEPDADDQANEGGLSNEVDTDQDDGEQTTNDWQEATESEPVKESSSNESGQTVHYSIDTCKENFVFPAKGIA